MFQRRAMLAGLAAVAAGRAARAESLLLDPALPQGVREVATLKDLPGKQRLIQFADSPPNYETPLDAFRTAITPNDRFFVRYHLTVIPEMEELRNWRLTIGGEAAERSLELTLDQLQRDFPRVEVTAVCQCSGNRRGLFQPHVPGVQWGVGAMGNARWTGARLKDILARAGVKAGAMELAMDGADDPVIAQTPDFVKSIPIEKALHEDSIIAYAMNGEALPHLNGFPARVIVPGWTATYWVKHVTRLELRTRPEENFWMKAAYRVPRGLFPTDLPFRTQQAETTEPITQILTNSLITNLRDGARVATGGFDLEGIAWDGGHGIRVVEISSDGGRSWKPTQLGEDLGRYAFRAWRMRIVPERPGEMKVMVRATNNAGQTQAERLVPNPAGYHHNVIQTLTLTAA
ncbi:MAG: molybdopterin-dependent oxidoreductase [Acetobacteraceae bacterium]|nr:molybdopterin-dependent oxidoreductase [Acetobacteraceae bacterium]MDI3305792.1 molybdopterin-dependent oxidoreductase [Acetobacteraceae bacterium]